MAGESVPVPEDSMDQAVRALALPAVDFTQELRACFSITDDRDYTAAKKSALYSPMEDDSVLRIDHRVAHAAALEEYSSSTERQAANSPFIRHMEINDIVNVVAESLAAKGLDFWKITDALHEAENESRPALMVFECLGFLPGRESNPDRQDPTRGLRRRVNAFRLAVHPDKMGALTRHLDAPTRQEVFKCCTEAVQRINALYSIACMQFDRVRRVLDAEARSMGNFGRWQETEPAFGWWLLASLKLDFIVTATSDIRWYTAGTYNPGVQPTRGLHSRMAFPATAAREWMQQFHRTDQALQLDTLIYHAYRYSKGIPMEEPIPSDLSCLNGFRVYMGLLNKINDYTWKTVWNRP